MCGDGAAIKVHSSLTIPSECRSGAPARHLHGPHSQRREAGRATDPAGREVRVHHKPADSQDDRSRRAADARRPRRRGDRLMKRREFITLLGGAAGVAALGARATGRANAADRRADCGADIRSASCRQSDATPSSPPHCRRKQHPAASPRARQRSFSGARHSGLALPQCTANVADGSCVTSNAGPHGGA